jgi:carboxyl-terminal processing protease
MNRERLAWTVTIVLMGFLVFNLPGSLAQRDSDYAFVRTLVDIHRRVSANYVDAVDEEGLRQSAINGMLENLDPFTIYVPPAKQEEFDRMLEGSFKGVGIQLNETAQGEVEVVTPIDGSPAFKAGVLAGDVIIKVNGESVLGQRMVDVIKKVAGPLGSEVKLTVRHVTGDEVELSMTREEIVIPTIKGYQRKADNTWDYYVCENPKVAYLRVTQFTPDTYESIKAALEQLLKDGMQGLIVDLRFNPGGRLDQAVQVCDLLIDKGVIVSTRGRSRPEQIVEATAPGTLPKFPMIVLVNEHSASASEIVAGCLKDNRRALVIGTRTYGKGSVQEVIPLDQNGGELKLTVAYYYLPSGRLVHKQKNAKEWGVEPNISVPLTAQQEEQIARLRVDQEMFKRPQPKVSTQPTTAPSTQPTDPQLQRSVDTLIAWVVLQQNERDTDAISKLTPTTAPSVEPGPTTAPATAPATQP